MDLMAALMETGLTRHEAHLYWLLSSEGLMTGYEAAKQSGISRSNAYMALAGLTEKGAAVRIDGAVTRYTAVATDEFCRTKRRHFDEVLACIEAHMPAQREIAEPFLTIKGQSNIINKMKDMVIQARYRIYVSMAPPEISLILDELRDAGQRGLKVVMITGQSLHSDEMTVYHADKESGQIRMIVDSELVLTGAISRHDESSCLFSRNQALVTLFKEAMINEIKLIKGLSGDTANEKT